MPKRPRSPALISPPRVRYQRRRFVGTARMVRMGAAARAARYGSYGLTAYTGYSIARAAYRRFRRAKRSRFGRTNIGEPVGTGTSKRSVTLDQGPVNQDTRTLYSYDITDIPPGSNIDQRERRIVNVRGFKICMEIKNTGSLPLYVNVAVLSPKGGKGGVNATDFFRSSDTERGRNLDPTLTSNEYHCLPINSDNYTILKHKRMRLVAGAGGGDTVSLNGYSYTNLNWWIPLKRQIRYESSGDSPDVGTCYLVYWFDQFGTGSGVLPVTGIATTSRRVVAYFKEPKN